MLYILIFVAAVFVILWGISIYFVVTKKMSAADWHMKSLGLPQGSVRATFALLILFLLIFAILTDAKIPTIPEWLIGILGTIIGFYFGAAMVPKPPSQPPKLDEGKTLPSQ